MERDWPEGRGIYHNKEKPPPGATPFPRRHKQTRWCPIFPPRESSSSPLQRAHLLSRIKHQNRSEILDLSYFCKSLLCSMFNEQTCSRFTWLFVVCRSSPCPKYL